MRAFSLYNYFMIDDKYTKLISKQNYSKKEIIDGVMIKELPTFNDDGGSFCEIFKIQDNFKPFEIDINIKQCSWAVVEPKVVKAFHIHKKQFDLWFVPYTEKILVGLYDLRYDSPTFEKQMRFVLGSGKSQLLFIPREVAHGYANLTNQRQNLFYFTSEYFELENNDEYRMSWDYLGTDFWDLKKE